MTGSGIFISYRRDDSSGHAGRLYDRLSERFGEDRIFMDIDAIEPGVDFTHAIDRALDSSKVVIALIGRRWLTATDEEGKRRLDNPHDFVRMEIARALEADVRVIPVLVQGTGMPSADELPDDLDGLSRRHAIELSDVRWPYDVGRLTTVIEEVLDERPADTGGPDGPGTEESRARRRRARLIAGAIAVALAAAAVVAFIARPDDVEENRRAAGGRGAIAGGVIAFVSDQSGSCEIHVINSDGTGERQLTDGGADHLRPDWSPDGEKLAYPSSPDGSFGLYVLDVDGGAESELFDHRGDERGPDWSPDGRLIAFSSIFAGRSEIFVLEGVNGGQKDVTQITDDGAHNVAPDWSPDGRRIAFVSNADGDFDIYVMDPDGSGRSNLTGDLFGGDPSNEFDPQWSPDGRRLAFEAEPEGEDFDIWTMGSDGSGARNLTAHSDNDRHSSWSPDGTAIVFGSDRRVPQGDTEEGCAVDERQRDLFVMNADGSRQRRLTRIEADDSDPAWRPAP